ncbi:AAA family ATPase [Methanobacterium formicicum]|uniref:AAA family ATPase n=1 Tax=Methanobacterium formicicum TaxID=2162 RepID=A0A843AJA0_METFO|nr:ATP-binding protein [Methanobacterium formicicum]MBF4475257.1 AAA family ATPase [Methanobacterium formicicum]
MNPFRKRTGIFPSYFTGRDDELKELTEIYESTRSGAAGHIIIYGPKGIGKTCLLIKFEEQLKDVDGVYPVRIPLIEGDFDEIYSLIVDKAAENLKISEGHFWDNITSLGVNIPMAGGFTVSRKRPTTSPSVALERILKSIYTELTGENPVLILLFDDLQRIIPNKGTNKVLSILQNALVELNLKGMNIMFVATGAHDIFSQIQDHLDSAVRIFEPYELKPLSKEEVNDAISIPADNEGVNFTEAVVDLIYEMSEGIPYYMQVLAYNCFAEAVDEEVGINELKQSFPRSLDLLAQREFRGMYEKSTNEERKILGLLAEDQREFLSYTEIKEGLKLKSEPSFWLRAMVDKNLIIKKSRGKYCLRDRLFKEYLKTFKPYKENGTY